MQRAFSAGTGINSIGGAGERWGNSRDLAMSAVAVLEKVKRRRNSELPDCLSTISALRVSISQLISEKCSNV